MELLRQKISDRAAVPWYSHPFDLISWMEIVEFSASKFLQLTNGWAKLEVLLTGSKSNHFPEEARSVLRKIPWPNLLVACKALGLTVTAKSVERLVTLCQSGNPPVSVVRQAFSELNQRFIDEIDSNLFLYIPKTHAAWYRSENDFSSQVQDSFPSTSYDIKEAGKCLALRRNTACVFHLMRVMGAGVTALGKSLNEPTLDASRNLTWDNVLRRCGKEVGEKYDKMSPIWQADKQFYAEATARLFAVKDAWRNPNAHEVGDKYTDEEAEDIYRTVRSFMRHLATKLKE